MEQKYEIEQKEFENNYGEIKVITGPNPKCPAGYKIIKTNLNDEKSDTKVIICAKSDTLPSIIEYNPNLNNTPDFIPFNKQNFPFGRRDDAFSNPSNIYLKKTICDLKTSITFLFIIIILIYLVCSAKIKKNNPIESETEKLIKPI